jgi:hypothetical protein
VEAAKNQHAPTRFEICDAYWPYRRTSPRENQASRDSEAPTEPPASQQPPDYVASIRERFLALGCSNGQFNAAQQALARQLQQQGVSLKRVEDAMLLAAYRKYVCWLNGKAPEPIASLRYFEPLIDELERQPVPEGYLNYLRYRLPQWLRSAASRQRHRPPHPTRSRLLTQKSNWQICWRKQCASRFQTR